MPCICVQLQLHLYTYTKVLRDESRKIKYFTSYGKFIKRDDSRNCNTKTHLVNLCPKSIPRTSPKDVLWTSPFGSLFNAKGCSLLTSWGQSRSSTKVFSTLKYDVLRTSQYSVLKMSSHCPICNNKELPQQPLEDVPCSARLKLAENQANAKQIIHVLHPRYHPEKN